MNVLIVHDREAVTVEISGIVLDVAPEAKVACVEDAVGARDALTADYFDLLVLDLTIANVAGRGEANYQAAEALLDEVFTPSRIFAPGNILGITREPDTLKRIASRIGAHVMAIIAEDDYGDWREDLKDRVAYVRSSQHARSAAWLTKHDYDLLLLTALDKELRPLRSMFEVSEIKGLPGVFEFVFNDRFGKVRRGACSAIGRAGQASAASEAQALVCQLRPRLAIMVGFCGGIEGKANLGDILIAESVIDWDFGKWKSSKPVAKLYARPEPISIRQDRSHRVARELADAGVSRIDGLTGAIIGRSKGKVTTPVIRLAPFASGSAVIADANVLENLRALNENVAGVDMESYGFYYACKYSRAAKPEFLCIKAVADDCGPSKDDELHEACCFASAEVARHIVAREWEF
jgi:nucleoside phosphorylase